MTDEEMAAHLRAKGWRIADPLTPDNCSHPNMTVSGSVGSRGSWSEGHCPDCGYSYKWSSEGFDESPHKQRFDTLLRKAAQPRAG